MSPRSKQFGQKSRNDNMRNISLSRILPSAFLLVALFGVSAQAGDVAFDLRIERGRVPANMRVIRVKQGDNVTLRWTSDRAINLHLHGYDIEKKLELGIAGKDISPRHLDFVRDYTPGRLSVHSNGKAPLVDRSPSTLIPAPGHRITRHPAPDGACIAYSPPRPRRPLSAALRPPCRFAISVGTAAAIVVSFLVVGLFMRGGKPPGAHPRIDLLASPPGRLLAATIPAFQLLTIGLFVVVILAGLFGNQNSYRNIAPTFVWVIFWVGLTFVGAGGKLWEYQSMAHACGRRRAMRRTGPELSHGLTYPGAPGLPQFSPICFGWTTVYSNAAAPAHLALFAIAYSVLT